MSNLNNALVFSLTAKQGILLNSEVISGEVELHEGITEGEQIMYITICVVLTLMSGFFSGLTIGLASIDKLDLELMEKTGSKAQK